MSVLNPSMKGSPTPIRWGRAALHAIGLTAFSRPIYLLSFSWHFSLTSKQVNSHILSYKKVNSHILSYKKVNTLILSYKQVNSLIYKEEAGQRRPREGGSAGPNLESEQEEYTRMEEVPALAGMVGKNEKAST